MSAERPFQLLPPNLSEKYGESYKKAPWFILLQDAPRVDSRLKYTNAEKGEIFQYDPLATQEADKNSEKPWKHSKPKKIIMVAIDSQRVKVEWAPSLFAPLSDGDKDLLIAIDSLRSRISIFNDPADYLSFGHELKVGDMVQVSRRALAKSQRDDVHGELKFKGPMMSSRGFEPRGTYFGVQLAAKCGSFNGTFKGTVYFRCGEDCGVFVPINRLVPFSKQKKVKHVEEVSGTRSNHPVGDTPKAPYFYKKGDKVKVLTTLKKPPRKDWIKGRVVTCKSHEGKLLIGVEVAQHHELAINTNGMYLGKPVFSPNNPAHTVLAEVVDVQPCQPTQQEYGDRHCKEKEKGKNTELEKGFFSTIAESLSSFGTVEKPPFPLGKWELGQISIGGEKLLKILAHDLQIKEADKIFRKRMDDFETTCELLRQWWEQLQEGHKAALEDLKYSLKKNEFGELVYFMEGGEPTDGEFHGSIVEIVVFTFGKRLQLLADKLKVTIIADELPESILGEQIFSIWQKRHPGTGKLSQLVHAIKEISKEILKTGQREQMSVRKAEELEDLALDLEQGLSESIIRSISSTVQKDVWYEFGYSLGLSQLRLNAMERKFPLSDRVFHVLRYWQIIQPYEVDQAQKLIVALQCCGLQQNIHIISKGLDEERLMKIAESVGDKWKIFACTVFGPNEIHHLLQSTERDQDKALSTLRKWKRKQPAFHRDLKNKLYDELMKYNLVKAARMVFDGLDRFTLFNLARQVLFDMQPLGKALGLARYDMRDVEKFNDPVQSSLAVLKLWNEKNGHDVGRIEKLCDALKHVGLEDVANWLRNLEDDEEDGCDVDCQSQKVSAEASGNPDGTPLDSKGAVGGQPAHDSEQTAENFNVNSMIEFDWGGKLYPGTILWVGHIPDLKDLGIIAGIETEEPLEFGGNSLLFRKMKTLDCNYDKGIFIPLKRCRPDSRFPSESQMKDDFTKLTKEDDCNTQMKATEEKMRQKEDSWEHERQQMEKRIKELAGEVKTLQDQLAQVNSHSKRLEEDSQRVKKRLGSKIADLKTELHQTKKEKVSSQTEVERLQKELKEAREQLQIDHELEKELDGEERNSQEQLKEVNNESQEMKQRLESKTVDLERELHQTKQEKTSPQTEVERFQKELKEAGEQQQRDYELEKRTSQVDSEDASPLSTKQTKDMNLADFGKFQYHLSLYLTQDVIRDLTLVLAFTPMESEQAEQDKIKFIRLMREKGFISQADITPLTSALETIGRHDVCSALMKL